MIETASIPKINPRMGEIFFEVFILVNNFGYIYPVTLLRLTKTDGLAKILLYSEYKWFIRNNDTA